MLPSTYQKTAHEMNVRNLRAELKDATCDLHTAVTITSDAARLANDTGASLTDLRDKLERMLDVIQRLEVTRAACPAPLLSANTRQDAAPSRRHDAALASIERPLTVRVGVALLRDQIR